jgi:hypothetical protein
VDIVSLGPTRTPFRGTVRTTFLSLCQRTQRATLTTSVPRATAVPGSPPTGRPTPVRWGISLPTGMGFMTWRGTWWNGVGIGLLCIRAARKVILAVPHLARPAWLAGAVGSGAESCAGRRCASTTTRPSGKTLRGSVPSSPQVSHEQEQQERSGPEQAGEARDRVSRACGEAAERNGLADGGS